MAMRYQSVDELQNFLAKEVFHYTDSGKKAAGRALGTLVEIVTFYLMDAWGLRHSMLIETRLPEFGNPEITHNVEYTLHPVSSRTQIKMPSPGPVLSSWLRKHVSAPDGIDNVIRSSNSLLSNGFLLRNCCVAYREKGNIAVAHLSSSPDINAVDVVSVRAKPYAMVECKRVGVEEGMKKGPQTIEKAKQGAYVAKTVSNLQKIRMNDGQQGAVLINNDATRNRIGLYYDMIAEVLDSKDKEILENFVLTVGVVSNHGNWFTDKNMNKETKILAQSYDWLIFLSDAGLSQFIVDLIVSPSEEFSAVAAAFRASYSGVKSGAGTQFTKTVMAKEADRALRKYFADRLGDVEGWFNVLAPKDMNIRELRSELYRLRDKPWGEILR